MSRVIKAKFDGYKINIKSINEKWWLDFYHNKKRIRKSTFLQDNDKNLEKIKSEIIPEIITALTGNTNMEYAIKSYTLDEFSKEYFEIYKDTVREHTFKRNREHYNNNIKPYFGSLVITAISPLEDKLYELQKLTGNYEHLFLSTHKKPFFSHDILNLRFKKLLIKIGIKERTLYNLRHTFASQMISNIHNGVDILWVSKMLGHKDVSITLKVYAKFIIDEDIVRLNQLKVIGEFFNL